jgi:ABC-type dipeptide/oligopeptide/nickel transport system ATPase component
MTRSLNHNEPIVLGLCGLAGTGKTSTARSIVPADIVREVKNREDEILYIIDHLVLATPLYEMASIRLKTEGDLSRDRILFGIHDVLLDLFSHSPLYGAPPYDELVAVVHTIASMPIEMDTKPRSFMQDVGTVCRSYDPDCFVKWIKRRINGSAISHIAQDIQPIYIVSDVRFDNEARMVKSFSNGLLVCFEADEETRQNRIELRDGVRLTEDQLSHESEQMEIDPSLIDLRIDTTELTQKQQAEETQNALIKTFDLYPF